MKKGLLAVVIVLACALVGAGVATAAEISTSGTVEFQISGTSEAGEPSGLFANGDVQVLYSVTLESGAFKANVTPIFDVTGTELGYDDAYIEYAGDMATVTMKPFGLDYGLYDLYGVTADGAPNIPEEPGIKVEVPFEPMTLTAVINNEECPDGSGKLAFNYGLGLDYTMESLTFGIMGNSACEEGDWYGTSYGGKVVYEMAPMTFTGEYGIFSPAAGTGGSGYYGKFAYAVDEMGDLTLSYTGADANFNGAGIPTAAAYAKIYGEWVYPVMESTDLTLGVTSEDVGDGTGSETSYEVTTETTLAENVTLTLDVEGSPSATTYSAKVGVSL